MKEGLFCTFCKLFFSFICFSHWWDWFFCFFVCFCFIYISHWPTADRGWHPEAVQDPGRHRAVTHARLCGAVHRVRWPHQWQAAWEVQGKVHQLPQVSAQRLLLHFSRYFVDSSLFINSTRWPCWKKFSSFLHTVCMSVYPSCCPQGGGWGCLMSTSCLESQGCHLILVFLSPLLFFYLVLLLFLFCPFSANGSFSFLFFFFFFFFC